MEVIGWLIVEKQIITFSRNFCFWMVTGWHPTGASYWSAPIIECCITAWWDVKREENNINIAKPYIHKAAGSGINDMIFSSFSWRYLMFIIHEPGLDKQCVQGTANMSINSCIHLCVHKILRILRIYVRLFLRCILLSVSWVSLVFLVFLQHTTRIVLFCGFFFTLPCIKLCVTGISFRGGW